jgi:hypothetical protein
MGPTPSAVPVDVISSQLLEDTGLVETWQQLQRLVPSLNAGTGSPFAPVPAYPGR